jgi:hypothetical protein
VKPRRSGRFETVFTGDRLTAERVGARHSRDVTHFTISDEEDVGSCVPAACEFMMMSVKRDRA